MPGSPGWTSNRWCCGGNEARMCTGTWLPRSWTNLNNVVHGLDKFSAFLYLGRVTNARCTCNGPSESSRVRLLPVPEPTAARCRQRCAHRQERRALGQLCQGTCDQRGRGDRDCAAEIRIGAAGDHCRRKGHGWALFLFQKRRGVFET